MNIPHYFPPSRQVALDRIKAINPSEYASSRNHLEGRVTGLSPYITHALVSLPELLATVLSQHPLRIQDKLIFELGWREYFRHLWKFHGNGIGSSIHQGPLPDDQYMVNLPWDIRQASTGIAVIDMAVTTLYASGYLHNHARMWLASYIVHIRKVHWRTGADWLYGHLLDGDLASNHLSWQWVAGTNSAKPYIYNADNVTRFAPPDWHCHGSILDQSYEALQILANQPLSMDTAEAMISNPVDQLHEPDLLCAPPKDLNFSAPDPAAVKGADVWLIHPWNLGALPASLSPDVIIVCIFISDFHQRWPWSRRRWQFVAERMTQLASLRWYGDSHAIAQALKTAHQVHSTSDPHLDEWLMTLAHCEPASMLFPEPPHRCDSFSKWWSQVSRGKRLGAELLTN